MGRIGILHVVTDEDRSGLFTGFARALDRARFDLRFACLGTPAAGFARDMAEAAVPLIGLGARDRRGYPVAALRLARYARSHDVHVLHAHVFDPTAVGLAAAWAAGVPVRIHTRHHSDYHTRASRPVHVGIDRAAALASTCVIAVSEHTRRHLVEVERIPASRVVCVPNALDASRVATATPERIREAAADLPGRLAPRVLVPARLHPEKGHLVLFEALAALRARGVVLGVLLAGDGPFAHAYRARVRELALDDQVTFLGHRPDVVALMAAVDLVVVPSSAEAFGLAALEALAVGARLVVSDAGALPEIVREGVDARMVPHDDARALADALEDFVRRGPEAVPRGPGRDAVLARFGFPRFVGAHEALYEELVGRGGVPLGDGVRAFQGPPEGNP